MGLGQRLPGPAGRQSLGGSPPAGLRGCVMGVDTKTCHEAAPTPHALVRSSRRNPPGPGVTSVGSTSVCQAQCRDHSSNTKLEGPRGEGGEGSSVRPAPAARRPRI